MVIKNEKNNFYWTKWVMLSQVSEKHWGACLVDE